jgi:hypothetical protein
MTPPRLVLASDISALAARRRIAEAGVPGAPVVDNEGRFEGAVAADHLPERDGNTQSLEAYVDATVPTVHGSANLDVAVDALTTAPQRWISVLDDDRTVMGTIATSDVVRGYRLGLLASLRQVDRAGDVAGTRDVEIGASSPLVGHQLRNAPLPDGVIVTTIERDRDVIVPAGDTVLQAGDHLLLIGATDDIESILK